MIGVDRNGTPVPARGPLMNPHMFVSGMSGSGKTHFLTNNIVSKAERGEKVIVFSWHNTFDHAYLDEGLLARYDPMAKVIHVADEGIPIPLFDALYEGENPLSIVGRVCDVLRDACNLGDAMMRCVKASVADMVNDQSYHRNGIAELAARLKTLSDGNDQAAANRALDRISPLTDFNVFRDGDFMMASEPIVEIDLSQIDTKGQHMIVKALVNFLMHRAMAGHFRECPVSLVIDECQNLDFKPTGTVYALLNEGRKLGLGLMLAAPSIAACGKGAKEVIPQCAFRAFFRPLGTDCKAVAKYIPGHNKDLITSMLTGLRTGEFIPVLTYNSTTFGADRMGILRTYTPPSALGQTPTTLNTPVQ